ncbi:MAG: putative quinol monooxygenase [Chloroflexota bacterium]
MIGAVMIAQALPDRGDEVAEFLRHLARQVRQESGNLRYDVCRYADDPSRFLVFEEYVDQAAFDSHMAAPHLAEAATKLPPLLASPLEVRLYEAIAG